MTVHGGARGHLFLSGITAGYGETVVLRDVSLTAPVGQVTALIGANGVGKTTLLRVAAGLLTPRSGSVEIDGCVVTHEPPHRRAAAGLCHVPDGRAVFASLTVRENLHLHDGGAVDDPLGRAFEAFPRLGERLNQVAGTMSGGEQQMLALARAYVSGARYVLIDEASMGLSPALVQEVFAFVETLARTGVGLLVVEQYVQHILAIADVVYILRKGAVVFAGQPRELDAEAVSRQYLGGDA